MRKIKLNNFKMQFVGCLARDRDRDRDSDRASGRGEEVENV